MPSVPQAGRHAQRISSNEPRCASVMARKESPFPDPCGLDILDARPLTSAMTLADLLKVFVAAVLDLLERFESRALTVEVTRRSTRWLFALRGFESLRKH